MGKMNMRGLQAAGLALALASMSGCMVDPLYAVYAVAGVGDDDTATAAAYNPGATPGQAYTVLNVGMGGDRASLHRLIASESVANWRKQDCMVMQTTHQTTQYYLAYNDPLVRQYGQIQDSAIRQAWAEKGCRPSYTPLAKLGLQLRSIDPQPAAAYGLPTRGVIVESIVPGSPAQRAGVLASDIFVAMNQRELSDLEDYLTKLYATQPGTAINLKTWRHGAYTDISIVSEAVAPPLSVLPISATTVSNASPPSSGTNLQGMSLGAVTPSYAQAAGLPSARGAWVIDTVKGSAADVAGIKPLDVIIEVAGQEIDSVEDVTAISSRMRVGYKTTVTLLREQKRRDVQLVLKK